MNARTDIPFIDLAAQRVRLGRGMDRAIARVLDHGRFILGPEVAQLEEGLCTFSGAKHAVTCGNGTDALVLAMMALEIGRGDAVLVPSFTFSASSGSVLLAGATPVFVDVLEDTFNVDPCGLFSGLKAAKAAGLKPRAVLAVDLFGQPVNYEAITDFCDEHGLSLIADAAQSFGASYRGSRVGTLGTVTTTSFFPSKPLGCYGDGGAVFTSDPEIANLLRSLRVHGQGSNKYDNVRIGMNSRLDTLQAAILLEKLSIFEDEVERRREVAARYETLLDGMVDTPSIINGVQSAWALYTVRISGGRRDRVRQALSGYGIPSVVYYPRPLHLQPAYRKCPRVVDLPVSESLCHRVLSLPIHPYMREETIEVLADTIKQVLCKIRRQAPEKRPVNVLFLHPFRYSFGAPRSLLELIKSFSPGTVRATVFCPAGPAAQMFAESNRCTVIQTSMPLPIFDHSKLGHYKGRRWLLMMREILHFPQAFLTLLRTRQMYRDIDLIHANTFQMFLFGVMIKRILHRPLLVHGREPLEIGRGLYRRKLIEWIVRRYVDAQVAIDRTVAKTLPRGAPVSIIHNSWTLKENILRKESDDNVTVVGMIGVLSTIKGCYDFAATAAICSERNLAMKFLLAGSNARLASIWNRLLYRLVGSNLDVRSDLNNFVARNNLAEYVTLCGYVDDVDSWYASIDVLCFPSHLDAIGRPVLEAALHAKPSVVALNPETDVDDLFLHGRTGLRVPQRSPEALADALEYMHRNPAIRVTMGAAARELAEKRFDGEKNARRMLELYHQLISPVHLDY